MFTIWNKVVNIVISNMTFSLLVLAHWIGDFAFQTNNMALNKNKSLKWLCLHVLAYLASIGSFSLVLFPLTFAWKFILINGALHWITDFFTSKLAYRNIKNPRIFYPIIGFDQMVHVLTLYWTLEIMWN